MSTRTCPLLLAIATATGMWAQSLYKVTYTAGAYSYFYHLSGINNNGQVVGGWSLDYGPVRNGSFLYSGGVQIPLPFDSVRAVNDIGQSAGQTQYQYIYYNDYLEEASIYSGGVSTGLGFPPGTNQSFATGINNSGQVVGYASLHPDGPYGGGKSVAFLYSGGVMTGLGFLPAGTWSSANGLNNGGQVVGSADNSSGHSEAFLYSDGVMSGLGSLPGYTDSVAQAINDRGQIAGYATDPSGNTQAFLYSDGAMIGLGFLPGGSGSTANALNKKGQIVGYSERLGLDAYSFYSLVDSAILFSDGQMHDLSSLVVDSPEALTAANGINDSGQIIASGISAAYLLTPLQGRFVPVAPCRVADTRTSAGPFGGPALDGVSARSFAIPQGACGIPTTAQAYSLNVTAVPRGPLSYLTLWPTGMTQPNVSTLNSFEGNVVANAAIVAAGQGGAVSVFALANNPTDVILDINGYFDSTTGDSFYPVWPCRVEDTRRPAGPLGGPALSTGETRDFPVPSSPCGLPAAASAYSMNVTVVPAGYLGFLTTWAAGQPQPFASTLNSWTGKVVANAAIVPAGANGATSVYVTNPTDVIVDANGYFARPGSPGALTFYPVVPCRVADTREADGGPILAAGTTRSFAIPESGCGIPSNAAAYALNITVVPDGPLGFLTAWPTGSPQPFVSTLNSWDGTVVANAATVSAGTDGAISIYVTNQTHVVLDINGYFAP